LARPRRPAWPRTRSTRSCPQGDVPADAGFPETPEADGDGGTN